MNQIEEIKNKIDIVQIIGEHIALKRAGRNYKALCPFHSEKTASFMVSPELQIFKCFGCGAGGDVFAFLQKIEGIDFPEALQILAKRVGVKLVKFTTDVSYLEKERLYQMNYLACEFYHYLLTKHPIGKVGLDYLTKQRLLSDEALEVFKLGYAPQNPDALQHFLIKKKDFKVEELVKAGLVTAVDSRYLDRFRGRVIFPLKDHRGNVLALAGRILPDDEKKDLAKYINSPESLIYQKRSHLYGLDINKEDIKKENKALIVEGELDLISCWQAGIRNVVAIKGTALTEDQIRIISRFCSEIILALDADFAGDQAVRRGIQIAQDRGLTVKVVELGQDKDPDEAVRRHPEEFKRKIQKAVSIYDFLIDSSFLRFDANTGDGKAKISKEIIPILAEISDKIVQAHYVKLFAQRIGVSEEAVEAQIEKFIQPKKESILPEKEKRVERKNRRQLLEEQLLTLVLQGMPEKLLDQEISKLLVTPHLSRIWEEAKSFLAEKKKFSREDFAKILPRELLDTFAILIMTDIEEFLTDPAKFRRLLDKVLKEIKIVDLKEKLSQLSWKIKQAEKEGGKGLKEAQAEFVKNSRELSMLEEGV